jgi:8-oxo-dGTP pyrophosphatase MutT (NUDIX family)
MRLEDLIDEGEIAALRRTYGPFPQRHHRLAVGSEHVDFWGEKVLQDRRGEVVLVVQRATREVLLHTKTFYPPGVYRLPSGGISWGESVMGALRREAYEETGLVGWSERLLGMERYRFENAHRSVPFVSYLFLLRGFEGRPASHDEKERISDFRWMAVSELATVAAALRSVAEDRPGRRDWGRFRALAHDLAYQTLDVH